MSDTSNNQDAEPQEGAVRDVDDPQVEEDTNSGGAPEDPDTDPSVYNGKPDSGK